MQINAYNQAEASSIPKFNLQNIIWLLSAVCIFYMFYASDTQKTVNDPLTSALPATASAPQNIRPVSTSSVTGVQHTESVRDIVNDALKFYGMLSGAQQSTLQLTYTTALARKWSNLPCGTSCRNGIQLGTNLSSEQYAAALQIVKDALSTTANEGYDEFHQMNLAEAYLHANGGASGYDSTLRWMAFLNTPTMTGRWMLQFGGHHYAANIAFNNGHVIGATPFFMGLEPKTFTYNSVSYDPLGAERDAFRALFASLSSAQLSTALISSSFMDCVMIPGETNGGASSFPAVNVGQALSSLTTAQQNLALAVIQLYVGDMDTATANNVMSGYTADISKTYISYHGGGSSGNASSFLTAKGDYMRISGPNVWVEFSCQGGIVIQGQIHYHTVWRDRTHDYGIDLTGPAIDGGSTGIADINTTKMLTVYPNPSTTLINMSLPDAVSNATISVTDMNGKSIYDNEHFSGEKVSINIHSFAEGHYFVYVRDHIHFYSGRFVKQ